MSTPYCDGVDISALAALRWLMSRDLRRDALRLCTAPFWAALSRATIALFVAASAASMFPESIDKRALRTNVFALDRMGCFLWRLRIAARCDFAAGTCLYSPLTVFSSGA